MVIYSEATARPVGWITFPPVGSSLGNAFFHLATFRYWCAVAVRLLDDVFCQISVHPSALLEYYYTVVILL